ncbi:MAG: glucose 1-dehydrogenase [Verrucomicrobia bacterium]|nr:glucose 1-dehydrogenase [Verrucomicrobiota bacterium]
MKVDLNGKVALVTGAARGIGQAIADMFCQNGAIVVYADLDHATAKKSASKNKGAAALKMDVSNVKQVEKDMEWIIKEFGKLDIVVNNAGVNTMKHRVNINQFPLKEWEWIVKIDLTGVFIVSKAASSRMIAQKSGRIINISSVFGLIPSRLQCAYVAAKAGVINLTKAMALELAPSGVLVNCVAPGSILTEGTKQLFYSNNAIMQQRAKAMLSHVPLNRPGKCEEIASAVLFLAAPESSYITGAVITVDGGWTAGYARDF